ncbi:MAG: DDE-type integrase/transposase/recombinase [Gammaproteobacteria bacterium]|nr:DDE-type integrase/transposase/recombinase [Gammaproteobacteria bacterium]
MPDESEAAASREQRNLRNNVTTLTTELAGLTTTINAQRNELNDNFRTLENRLDQVEGPQMLHLTGGRSTDSLPTYEGDTDFDDWLSLFTRVKEAYNWSEARALKILPAYLRGNAADLYSELSNEQKVTITDLINNLRAALEPDEMARITQSKLIKRKMQPYESVVDFAAAIQRLVRSAYRQLPADAQDTLMRNHFIERVRPDIKRYLLLMDPKDYQTAKRKAIQIETHNVELENDEDSSSSSERRKGEKKHRILVAQEDTDMKTLLVELLKELKMEKGTTPPTPNGYQGFPGNWPTEQPRPPLPQQRSPYLYNETSYAQPRRSPWAVPRQSNWQNQNRNRGRQRPQFRRQGPPSGRLVCYKCGRYDHTSVICPQNRGRTLGGQQPFWRTQNFLPQRNQPGVMARSPMMPGTVNGIRTPVVYQYLSAPVQEQIPNSSVPQECVFLELETQNQVQVLQGQYEEIEGSSDEVLSTEMIDQNHLEDTMEPNFPGKLLGHPATIQFQTSKLHASQSQPDLQITARGMQNCNKIIEGTQPWNRDKIGILRKRRTFCYKCGKNGHLSFSCSQNWYPIYKVDSSPRRQNPKLSENEELGIQQDPYQEKLIQFDRHKYPENQDNLNDLPSLECQQRIVMLKAAEQEIGMHQSLDKNMESFSERTRVRVALMGQLSKQIDIHREDQNEDTDALPTKMQPIKMDATIGTNDTMLEKETSRQGECHRSSKKSDLPKDTQECPNEEVPAKVSKYSSTKDDDVDHCHEQWQNKWSFQQATQRCIFPGAYKEGLTEGPVIKKPSGIGNDMKWVNSVPDGISPSYIHQDCNVAPLISKNVDLELVCKKELEDSYNRQPRKNEKASEQAQCKVSTKDCISSGSTQKPNYLGNINDTSSALGNTSNPVYIKDWEEISNTHYNYWLLPTQYNLLTILPQHLKCERLRLDCKGTKIIWGVDQEVDLKNYFPERDHNNISICSNKNVGKLLQRRTSMREEKRKQDLTQGLEPDEKRFMQNESIVEENEAKYICDYCIDDRGMRFRQLKELKQHVPRCRGTYLRQMKEKGKTVNWIMCPHDSRHMVPKVEQRMHTDLLCDKREFSLELTTMLQDFTLGNEKNQSQSNKVKETQLPTKEETSIDRCERLLKYLPSLPTIETWANAIQAKTSHQTETCQELPNHEAPWDNKYQQLPTTDLDLQLVMEYIEQDNKENIPPDLEDCIPGQFTANGQPMLQDDSMGIQMTSEDKISTCTETSASSLGQDNSNQPEANPVECSQLNTPEIRTMRVDEPKPVFPMLSKVICDLPQEDITVSEAYSSTYWPDWLSWPDLTLAIPPPARANRTKRWRSCSSLFLHSIAIMAIGYLLMPGVCQALQHNAPRPMLCQSSKAGTLWRLPKTSRCHTAKSSSSSKMFITTLRLFKKNLIKYESKAYHCRIVYHEVQTFTYLFANRRLKKDKVVEKSVGIEECRRMQQFKRCEHGKMKQTDGLWQTTNKMNWDYPGGFFQCCTWVTFRTTNCFLMETKVFKSHSDRTMDGLINGVGHCNYHQGSCELSDGSALLWQPNKDEKCEYIVWKVLKGESLGKSWLTMDHNFALTQTNHFIRECRNTLFISRQGIAYQTVKNQRITRKKRQTAKDETGLITSDQLSSQLQALEITTRQNINFAFKFAVLASCQNLNSLLTHMTHLMMTQPTAAVRTLLNKTTIIARSSFNMIEVFPCAELPANSYEFLAMNDTCTKDIPLHFKAGEKQLRGYLDISTNVIHESSTEEDCGLVQQMPISIRNHTFLYNGKTGKLTALDVSKVPRMHLHWSNFTTHIELQPTVFQELIMYKLTDFQSKVRLEEIINTFQKHNKILEVLREQSDQYSEEANTMSQNIVKRGLFGFLWGNFLKADIIQLWIFLVCCKVTITILMDACLPKPLQDKLTLNIPALVKNKLAKPPVIQLEMEHLPPLLQRQSGIPSKKSVRFSDIVEEHILEELTDFPDDERNKIASISTREEDETVEPYFYKVSSPEDTEGELLNKTSAQILMIATQCTPNIATSQPAKPYIRLGPSEFPITIEGVELIALLDTGSTLTVLPLRTVRKLGLADFAPPTMTTATSMTGHILSFLGTKKVNMKIGNEHFSHEVHIAPDTSVKYEVIIGTDLLKHMPKFTIDYKNGMAKFNHSTLPIGAPKILRKVCLEQGIEIPPRVQVTLIAKLQGFKLEEEGKPFILEPVEKFLQTSGLAIGQILVAPNNDGSVPVMLINTGVSPVYIYPKTTMVSANEVTGYYAPTEQSIQPNCFTPETSMVFERMNLLTTVDMVTANVQRPPAEFYSPLDKAILLSAKTEQSNENINLERILNLGTSNHEHLRKVHISDELTEIQKKQLKDLLGQYANNFSQHRFDLGKAKDCEHTIETGDAPPFKSRPYRIPIAQRPEVDSEIKKMVQAGIVRESKSPYSSPVILIRKPDGTNRFVVDYRKLNLQTLPDCYPIPRIDETLERLVNVKYFTTLDLSAGYWQVPLADDGSIEKSAFVIHSGLWEFTTLAFGMNNGPSTFQRLMGNVIKGLDGILCYIDDIIIFSTTWEEHLENLEALLKRLQEHNLKLKPEKCTFGAPEVNYLGHVVNKEGIRPDSSKLKAISKYPVPTDLTAVRKYLGLVGYYRRFVPHFSTIAAPLYQLMQKHVKFVWTKECQHAFEALRDKLCEAPVLILPDYNKPFTLYCDASNVGVGSVLCQEGADGHQHPIAYYSRTLNCHEKRYSTIEQECLSIVASIKVHRAALWGRKFHVITDHSPLTCLMNKQNDTTGRIARWALQLQEYNFTIEHKSGKTNVTADALSRYPVSHLEEHCYCLTLCATESNHNCNLKPIIFNATEEHPSSNDQACENMSERQRNDPVLAPIIDYLEHGTLPLSDIESFEHYTNNYAMGPDLCLYRTEFDYDTRKTRKHRLVVPQSLQEEILSAMHDDVFSGHFGLYKTMERIRRRYFWENMMKMIRDYVANCKVCAARKPAIPKFREPLQSISAVKPFDLVGLDALGPLPLTINGKKHVLVMVDYLTKWVELYSVETLKTTEVAQVYVEQFICSHGCPLQLLTDQGPSFTASLFREINDLLRVRKIYSTPYHPACNGLAERTVQTVINTLACLVSTNSNQWDTLLPFVKFAINSSSNESTRESPYFLLYGRDPHLPIEAALSTPKKVQMRDIESYVEDVQESLQQAWDLARKNIHRAQQRQQQNFNQKVNQVEYRVGQKVWLSAPFVPPGKTKKFARKYIGPFRIISINRPNAAIVPVSRPNKEPKVVHCERLKPYVDLHISTPMEEGLEFLDINKDEEIQDENPEIIVTPPSLNDREESNRSHDIQQLPVGSNTTDTTCRYHLRNRKVPRT